MHSRILMVSCFYVGSAKNAPQIHLQGISQVNRETVRLFSFLLFQFTLKTVDAGCALCNTAYLDVVSTGF